MTSPETKNGGELEEVPPPMSVPDWPPTKESYIEHERAKIRNIAVTRAALVQFREEYRADRLVFGERLQALHDAVTRGRVESAASFSDVRKDLDTVRESNREIAGLMGRLAADLYGTSRDTREKLDSLSDVDKGHDDKLAGHEEKIAKANIDAARARFDAQLANAKAEKSAAEVKLAQAEATLATNEASIAKRMAKWKVGTIVAVALFVYRLMEVLGKGHL